MDNEQSAYYDMLQAVATFFAQNTAITTHSTAMTAAHLKFEGLRDEYTAAVQMQDTDTTGDTEDKADARTAAEAAVLTLAAGVAAVADGTGNSDLEKEAHVAPSTLSEMGDDAFHGRARKIITLATANTAALAGVGIAAADITAVTAKVDAWEALQGKPRGAISLRVRGTKELVRLKPELDKALADQLDRLMRVATATNPGLFDQWQTVREIVDNPTQVRALTVAVKTASGEPVSGAAAVITPGDIQKSTGAEGIFYMQNMAPGGYQISVSKPGLVSINGQDFTVAAGEMTSLELTMQVVGSGGD